MFWLYILIGLIVFLLVAVVPLIIMLRITVPIAKEVYFSRLTRNEPGKWGRECSEPSNAEQFEMWNEGIKWAQSRKSIMSEHMIENEGLKLYGEYYDNGSDKCVIILPGRCESLMYSYFYAPPYDERGFNILVIDTRAHGNSDGVYNTVGVHESGDLRAWIKYAEDKLGVKEFYIHAICIGSAAAIKAMTDPGAPESVLGIVCDGCFVSFRETFKTHMIADNRPLFPVLDLVMHYIKKYGDADINRYAPIKMVGKLRCRMLFFAGRKDVFSLPDKSQKLFDACGAPDKQLIWFDEGGHSHLRINNTQKYDDAVKAFVSSDKAENK